MGGCFCLSLLPVVWDELGPERNQASMKLGQEYTTEAYDKIKQTAPDIRVKNISGNAYLYSSEAKTLRDVNAGNGYLSLTVELFGGYDSVQHRSLCAGLPQRDRCRAAVQRTAG